MTKTGRGNWLPGNARRGSLAYSTAAHWAFPRARSWLGESPELAPWGKISGHVGDGAKKKSGTTFENDHRMDFFPWRYSWRTVGRRKNPDSYKFTKR